MKKYVLKTGHRDDTLNKIYTVGEYTSKVSSTTTKKTETHTHRKTKTERARDREREREREREMENIKYRYVMNLKNYY